MYYVCMRFLVRGKSIELMMVHFTVSKEESKKVLSLSLTFGIFISVSVILEMGECYFSILFVINKQNFTTDCFNSIMLLFQGGIKASLKSPRFENFALTSVNKRTLYFPSGEAPCKNELRAFQYSIQYLYY